MSVPRVVLVPCSVGQALGVELPCSVVLVVVVVDVVDVDVVVVVLGGVV